MFRRVSLINQVLRSQKAAFASTPTPKKKPAIPLITCKNTKFNLMHDVNNEAAIQGAEIELSSKGWQSNKAKGDHFTIHPSRNVTDSNLVNSTNVEDLGLNEQLITNLKEKHDIHKATKLQKDAIDQILERDNVLIAAETGCGKVCSFKQRCSMKLQLCITFRLTLTCCR